MARTDNNTAGVLSEHASPSSRMVGVPGQFTNTPDVTAPPSTLRKFSQLMLKRLGADSGLQQDAVSPDSIGADDQYPELLQEILTRKSMLESEQARLRTLYRRLDNLYYAFAIDAQGGADHWADERPKVGGQAHISVNTHKVYVDVPAALQATAPNINYVRTSPEKAEREAAERREQFYFAWRDQVEMELVDMTMCQIKCLYGDAYVKVFWDPIAGVPLPNVIESPENLYVGWANRSFDRMDWAIYCYRLSPQATEEDFGVKVGTTHVPGGGDIIPWVYSADHADPLGTLAGDVQRQRRVTQYEISQIEIYDYWYKVPTKPGKPPKVYNAIFAGNYCVKAPFWHKEYDDIPYVHVPNSRVPGQPNGRPELYDVEQILREKDERLTQQAQMIHSAVRGQRWQLTGPEAPDEVPPNVVPLPNEVIAPGPGNRIEAITPFMPEFQVEDYLKRLDREAAVITGMNDLLLGLAPQAVLGSSKAIHVLVSNYESRINPSRLLLYRAYKQIWEVAARIWERKDPKVKTIIDGHYRIDIEPPELTPRDEAETAQMAINLVQNRLWSMERGMNATGIDEPGGEKVVIRDEQTDATLNPAAAMTMMQVVGMARQEGLAPDQAAQQQAQQVALNATRSLNPPAHGTNAQNGAHEQPNAPGASLPANTQGGAQAAGITASIETPGATMQPNLNASGQTGEPQGVAQGNVSSKLKF